jgi:hypothetical protein
MITSTNREKIMNDAQLSTTINDMTDEEFDLYMIENIVDGNQDQYGDDDEFERLVDTRQW